MNISLTCALLLLPVWLGIFHVCIYYFHILFFITSYFLLIEDFFIGIVVLLLPVCLNIYKIKITAIKNNALNIFYDFETHMIDSSTLFTKQIAKILFL